MAINSTFYLDAADLATATAVYLDLGLTLIAPDAFYGDGTISRQQSSGILLTAEICPECSTPCGTFIDGTSTSGVSQINLNVGSINTGAIIIVFDPDLIPNGIRVTYDGVVYNKISSPVNGPFESPNSGHFSIIGSTGSTGTCGSWFPSGETQTNNVFLYNPDSTNFDNTGATQVDIISPSPSQDWFLAVAQMQDCVMVIPKPSSTPSQLLIEVLVPCGAADWDISTLCPAALPIVDLTAVFSSLPVPCGSPLGASGYFAKVHTAVDSYVGLYDYIFYDENGQSPFADGYYGCSNVAAPNNVIHIVNGVVVGLSICI